VGHEPALGPWQSNGRYGANARMLLFLRELAGEASVDHGRRPTLYQRLIYAPIDWLNRPAVIAHITSVLGIDYADLTDRQALASVTAGSSTRASRTTCRATPRGTTPSVRVCRARSRRASRPRQPPRSGEHTLAAADGGHAALYLMGDGPRGISLELVSMAPTRAQRPAHPAALKGLRRSQLRIATPTARTSCLNETRHPEPP
jgi:hypothetical protein